ncbi:MAG: hypothetical protein IK130_04185 [Oscillospiraceae bacterium]|nr:hypothetical protein [Oscillospiraceae bacterium]
MKNLIRQTIFVMRKKTSTYVIPAILFCFAMLSCYIEAGSQSIETTDLHCYFTYVFGSCIGVAMLLCAIGSVLFLRTDLNDGFIKNIAGSTGTKMQYYLPKLLVLAGYDFLLLCSLAAGALLGSLLFLNGLEAFDLPAFLAYFGAVWLLLTAFSVLISFLVFSIRSGSAPMAFAVVLGSGMFYNLFYGILTMLLAKAEIEFDFSKVSLTMKMVMLDPSAGNSAMLSACVLAFCYILVFGYLARLTLVKKDIA